MASKALFTSAASANLCHVGGARLRPQMSARNLAVTSLNVLGSLKAGWCFGSRFADGPSGDECEEA